VIAAR